MRLLCGFDGSPASLAAACLAAGVARQLDAELTVVHVARRAADGAASERADAPDGARSAPGPVVDTLREMTGAEIALRVETGAPAAVLRRLATELDCDLLVVGHPRRSSLRDLVAPSVARRLAAAPPCPVVLVPEDASAQVADRLVVGSHDTPASHAAIETAAQIAGRIGARLVLVRALGEDARPTGWERYDTARRQRRTALDATEHDVAVELVERAGDPVTTLAQAADSETVDWVVVGQPRRWGAARLRRPKGSELALEAPRPVVVVPVDPD